MLCDRKLPVKLKGKIYKTLVWPAWVYGAETWSTTNSQEKRLHMNEMRTLRLICGVTQKDTTRIEHVRGSVKAAPATIRSQRKG